MNIVYLFLTYKNPELLLHTIQRLKAPHVEFYVHVDASSGEDFSCLQGIEGVYVPVNQYNTKWGGYEIAFTILYCLRDIQRRCHADYIILMSESDYPIKSNWYIRQTLAEKRKDFITITPLPHPNPLHTPEGHWLEGGRRRYECYALRLKANSLATIEPKRFDLGNFRHFVKVMRDNPAKLLRALRIFWRYPRRKHPEYLRPCGGELWFILRGETVDKIVDFCARHPDYLDYCKDTAILDELFIPTLVNYLVPESERENSTLRYINWQENGGSSPAYLTMNDKKLLTECILEPDKLFVRKVQDMEVCHFIDQTVREHYINP